LSTPNFRQPPSQISIEPHQLQSASSQNSSRIALKEIGFQQWVTNQIKKKGGIDSEKKEAKMASFCCPEKSFIARERMQILSQTTS
jgi:hypothetical protein